MYSKVKVALISAILGSFVTGLIAYNLHLHSAAIHEHVYESQLKSVASKVESLLLTYLSVTSDVYSDAMESKRSENQISSLTKSHALFAELHNYADKELLYLLKIHSRKLDSLINFKATEQPAFYIEEYQKADNELRNMVVAKLGG